MSPPSTGKFKNLSSEEREFLEALESSGELVEDLMEGVSRDPSPAPSTPKTKKIKLTKEIIKEQLFLEVTACRRASWRGWGGGDSSP